MATAAVKRAPGAAAVSVAEAKATLSAVLHRVEQKRIPVTIMRRGLPVAQIIPFPETPAPKLRGSMAGTGRELGDIVSPIAVEWTTGGE